MLNFEKTVLRFEKAFVGLFERSRLVRIFQILNEI